ncbi:urease accessory protein UreF [Mucilaginibacter paludis]|uniref:Urease accessory protein UreF n=1 Tax=Mucilaginibacter paludis DSM 18603 TaxID=714943 RepID=H1Y7Y1_9SPHI|nr:urease accessory protein UreF [Mucilaginibacter paludis]EHQ30467.1 Urease accessory protein ureF [Mucilaginibacter paludis DSM 18603]
MSAELLHLLQLADPTLPIGGFSHSSGLETYVQAGIVNDAASAKSFVVEMLTQNLQYTDAALMSLAYNAAINNDIEQLLLLDAECTAVKLPQEMRQASQKLGTRLLKIFQPFCGSGMINQYKTAIDTKQTNGNYCISFGLIAATLQIPKQEALTGFYYNAAMGMITNCVKLIPLGQQDGQQLLFAIKPLLTSLTALSMHPDRDLIGLCCPGFDVRCMQHEDLYSRLYMS